MIKQLERKFVRSMSEEQQELENHEALQKTGFWGKRGAGCLPFAEESKRFLFSFRSANVQEPHTWGIWGGAINEEERPAKAALREFKEETGYSGKILKLHPLSTYKDPESAFKYFSYLLVVPKEFRPNLDWETEGYKWVDYDRWPTPLHPKVKLMLANFKIDQILQETKDDPRMLGDGGMIPNFAATSMSKEEWMVNIRKIYGDRVKFYQDGSGDIIDALDGSNRVIGYWASPTDYRLFEKADIESPFCSGCTGVINQADVAINNRMPRRTDGKVYMKCTACGKVVRAKFTSKGISLYKHRK